MSTKDAKRLLADAVDAARQVHRERGFISRIWESWVQLRRRRYANLERLRIEVNCQKGMHVLREWRMEREIKTYDKGPRDEHTLPVERHRIYMATCIHCGEPHSKRVRQ